jgi:hypothetical protein
MRKQPAEMYPVPRGNAHRLRLRGFALNLRKGGFVKGHGFSQPKNSNNTRSSPT